MRTSTVSPDDTLGLLGKHVRVTTNDGNVTGILRGYDSVWIYLEAMTYLEDSSSGVRKHHLYATPSDETTCMIKQWSVTGITKLHNVTIQGGRDFHVSR